MFDRHDDAREAREEARPEPAQDAPDAREAREARPHHMIVSDGELLDIGPDAEPIDEAARADLPSPDPAASPQPRYGRRATDRKPK